MKKLKEKLSYGKRGITLIALVVTIIVLLILAGVTIATLTGDNGILTRAQEAKNKTEEAQKNEEDILNSYEDKINEYTGVDWDTALADAKKHPDQKTSTAVGVGTDGKAVNMDFWEYTLLEDGTYTLNDDETLVENETRTTGYTGNILNGKIEGTIPTYISEDNGLTFKPVTSMYCTFIDCSELITFPQIPYTITDMESTFQGCTKLLSSTIQIPEGVKYLNYTFQSCMFEDASLINIPKSVIEMKGTFAWNTNLIKTTKLSENVTTIEYIYTGCSNLIDGSLIEIPDSVVNMSGAFRQCSNLEVAPTLPENLINMQQTFSSCSKLKSAPQIPNKVENLNQTFMNCTLMDTPPVEIPNSVINMYRTFYKCPSLSGTIEISANLNGNILDNGYEDYYQCFWDTALISGKSIILKCSEKIYNLFYDSNSKNNIKANICYEGLPISLIKQ